jgi:hypothetical protein
MAAGKGCSGARRYSANRTRIPLARPSRAASSPSLRSDPSSKPPPCRNRSTRPVPVPRGGQPVGGHPAGGHLPDQHVVRHRMKAVSGGESGAALFQRRRGLAGTGPAPVPQGVDRVLHGLARHVGISFGLGCLATQQPYGTPGTSLSASAARPARAEAAAPYLTSDGLPVREHFAEPPRADVKNEPPDRNVLRDPRM